MCYSIVSTEMYCPKSYTYVLTEALYYSGNDVASL